MTTFTPSPLPTQPSYPSAVNNTSVPSPVPVPVSVSNPISNANTTNNTSTHNGASQSQSSMKNQMISSSIHTTVPVGTNVPYPLKATQPVTGTSNVPVKPSIVAISSGHMSSSVPVPVSLSKPNIISGPSSMVPTPTTKPSKASKKSKKSSASPRGSGSSSGPGSQGENTGRWTAEEHRLFLEGLEKHGKGWKKIASLIKSRTVVQIRTHAQKYFQKLAKARQNGEEGDVSMEGRVSMTGSCASGSQNVNGGMTIPNSMNQDFKRRRAGATLGVGTKRKCISSVVASAQREGKRLQEANKTKEAPLPSVAPTLQPFVMTSTNPSNQQATDTNPNANIPPSAAVLEDSLYRFLTPLTADFSLQVPNPVQIPTIPSVVLSQNDVDTSKQNNHFIVLPKNNITGNGEGSPTCVADFSPNQVFSSMPAGQKSSVELPQWYSRGGDVDELLDEADALDWLADSGDLDDTYIPNLTSDIPLTTCEEPKHPGHTGNLLQQSEVVSLCSSNTDVETQNNIKVQERSLATAATDALPPVQSSSSSNDIASLQNLFESSSSQSLSLANKKLKLSTPNLFAAAHSSSGNLVDENFSVFDSALDEQAFVSALLENNENGALSILS